MSGNKGASSLGRSTVRFRKGIAAAAVVLATGGLILFRAGHGGQLPTIASAIASPSGVNAASFSGPGAHGTLSLSHTKVLADSREKLFAEVRLTADKAENQGAHAPISLVVVLDTSGSMNGQKIADAKKSVVKLIRQMDEKDELAVVRYSDTSEVVQSLGRVGEVRESAIARVEALHADGGTAIPRGLSQGLSELARTHGDRVRRVVLVSDGLDSTRVEAERIASNSFERGITISSLGIGLDFDESYMSSVSRAGHGNFGFVNDDANALASFLKRELDETASTVVENAALRVKLPQGVTFTRASGADVRTVGESEIELKLGSLFSGDERRVMLELETHLENGDVGTFDTHASWDRVGGAHASLDVSALKIVATNDRAEAERGRDPGVLASVTSVLASRRQMEAAEAYGRGDVTAAEKLVEQNMLDLRAAASTAPPAAAPALERQMAQYQEATDGFRHHAAGSAAAKALPKKIMQADSANVSRSAF